MREPDSVIGFVQDARTTLDELKGKQQVGGNNLLYYRTSSSATYDISKFLQGTDVSFLITLTYTNSDHFGIIYFNYFYRLDNPDVMASPEPVNTSTAPEVTILGNEVTPPEVGRIQYVLTLKNNTYLGIPQDFMVYIKVFFTGTSSGTFDAIEI